MRVLIALLSVMFGLPAPAAAARRPLAKSEHQVIIDGVRLWCRVAGKDTPVLFLHGGPGHGSQTFARFAGPPLEAVNRTAVADGQRPRAIASLALNRAIALGPCSRSNM